MLWSWPADPEHDYGLSSREARPKQLLNLLGERSLLQATLDRLGELVTR